MVLCLYGFRVNLCSLRVCVRGAVSSAVKSLSGTHTRGRQPFRKLNESDFGFQTVVVLALKGEGGVKPGGNGAI